MHKNHQLVNIFLFYFYAKRAPKMRNFKRGDFRPPLRYFVLFFISYQEQQHSKQQKENHFFSVRR